MKRPHDAIEGERFEHGGVVYQVVPAPPAGGCSGCAFQSMKCDMPERPGCHYNDVIFVSLTDLIADKLVG